MKQAKLNKILELHQNGGKNTKEVEMDNLIEDIDELIKNLKIQFKLKKNEAFELHSLAKWLINDKKRYAAVIDDYLKNNSFFFFNQIFEEVMLFLRESSIPFYPVGIVVRAIVKNIAKDDFIVKKENEN